MEPVTDYWREPVWPEEVELQTDLAPSDWILPRLLPSILSVGGGTPVASVVPSGYPAYVRVLHPADLDCQHPSLTWREVAAWSGRTYHPLMQFEALKTPTSTPVARHPLLKLRGPATCSQNNATPCTRH